MTARTTAAAGFWDATGTWTGGVVPGAGDTVTLNHAVTLRDARTIGVSPAAGAVTPAVKVNTDFTINGSGNLTCRGDIALNTGNLICQDAFVLEFDAHLAGTPSTARYICGSSTFGSVRITFAGSSGNRGTIRSNSGGANGRIKHKDVGEIVCDYCDFQRIGDSSNPAYEGAAPAGQTLHFGGGCTFDANCGVIGNKAGSTCADGSIIELINVTHRGAVSVGMPADNPLVSAGSFGVGNQYTIVTVGTTNWTAIGAASNTAGVIFTATGAGSGTGVASIGTRTISGCRFAGDVALYRCDGYFISGDNVFEGGWDTTGAGPIAKCEGNMFAMPLAGADFGVPVDTVKDTVVLRVGNPSNQHGLSMVDGVSANYDGLIFDGPDVTDGVGDCITMNAPSAAQTIAVKNCIVLPTDNAVSVGTLVSMLGGANLTLTAEHNTFFAVGACGVYVGESYAGHSDMLHECRSNIAWNPTAGSAKVIHSEPGVVTDVVLSANANHNGKWNPLGTGYDSNLSFSSGTPGTGDISGDPQFVDRTRNIKTWDTSLGGAGTVANALTELRKKNDAAGYNSNYTIAAYLAYVRAGFAVANSSMRTGAHDGTVMGAVQTAPPSGSGKVPWPFFNRRAA